MVETQRRRTWSDEKLADAIRLSTSWRGVSRQLGLKSHSSAVLLSVRRRAEELELDISHFRGARSWSDAQLRSAVSTSRTWDEVIEQLGLSLNSGSIRPFLKSHAVRLGIDYGHLTARPPAPASASGCPCPEPDLEYLRTAGESIAAAWFTWSGCTVSIPVEPAIYDLICELPDGIKRVQVKTTTFNGKNGWEINVGHKPHDGQGRRPHAPYELSEIDLFFIVDGDFNMYLIPTAALAGAVRVLLRPYKHYIIGSARGFLDLECQAP